MKTLMKFFGLLLTVAVAGCSTAQYAPGNYDDIYYTPEVVRAGTGNAVETAPVRVVEVVEEEAARPVAQDYPVETETPEYIYDDNGNQIIINNHYYGDYYDYAYAARIRRFHRPYRSFGYYDPFFTNMYFYTHIPHTFGVSIYLGHGAVGYYYPGYYYHPGFFTGPSWHYRHWAMMTSPFHYHGYWGYRTHWGVPYWSAYSAGYHSGFHHGWMFGGYPHRYYYDYNSFDRSRPVHYGHRGSTGSTIGRTAADREQASFAERFESQTRRDNSGRREVIAQESISSGREGGRTSVSTAGRQVREADREITQAREQGREIARSPETRPAETQQTARRPANSQVQGREQNERGGTAPRYARPQQTAPERQASRENNPSYTRPRTYTSPSYQQPGTTQRGRPTEATRPADTRTSPAREQATPSQPPQTRPAGTTTQPSRTERGRPSYTPPRQQPSRSTTSPARTTTPPRTTTAPARSTSPSRSSTAPARSTSPSRSSTAPARSTPPSRSSTAPARSSSRSSSGNTSSSRSSSSRTSSRSGGDS